MLKTVVAIIPAITVSIALIIPIIISGISNNYYYRLSISAATITPTTVITPAVIVATIIISVVITTVTIGRTA